MSDVFDPVEFKTKMRTEWRSAAAGWRKWHDVVEAEEGGQFHSRKLVELAGIKSGDTVLDVAGGYGGSVTAARAVGPSGRVVCTDISPEMLAFGQGGPQPPDSPTSSSSPATPTTLTSLPGASTRSSAGPG